MASKHQHGYQYDLFLSYSSRDAAWVRQFHDDLITDVNRFADHDIFPFLDQTRLQPGFVWDDKLLAAANNSAILLPILSPRFLSSDYCQKEINAFISAHGLASGLPHRGRIMPLQLLCAAPTGHDLARFQATRFCTEGPDNIPFEHAAGSPAYRESLRKLAVAIAQVLASLPPKQHLREAVYLAPDFQEPSKRLRASLGHYYDVLPLKPEDLLGLSPDELHQSLTADFARCFVSVHPLSNAPFAESLIKAHLDFARTQHKPRLIWSVERPDDLTNAGFEWFTSQAEIEDRIRRLHQKPPEAKSSRTDRLVYFLCPDRANKARAESLLDHLEHRGVHLYPSPLEGPADQAVQTHISALDDLDGCLIYYGDVDRSWFDAVFLRVQKKIRQRGLPSAIYLAPPSTPHKTQDLRYLGVPVVENADAAVQAFMGAAA